MTKILGFARITKYSKEYLTPNKSHMSKSINEEIERLEKKAELTSGAAWAKFPNVGDSIQGALVTRRLAMSPTQQEQIVYVVKNDEGVFNVAFKSNYPIHKDFANALVGQVMKVKLTGLKPHKQKGFNPIKLYTVTTDPSLLDETMKDFLADNGFEFGAPLPALEGAPAFDELSISEEPATADVKPLGSSIPKV